MAKKKGKGKFPPGVGRKLLHGAGRVAAAGARGTVNTAAAGAKGTVRYGAEKAYEKVHAAISEAEQDNAALETAHKAERLGEKVLRRGFHKGVQMARDHRKKSKNVGKKAANLGNMWQNTLKVPVNLAPNPPAPAGNRKFHPGKAPASAKPSPLKGILATPAAQFGSHVDFGPKQPGLLSRGLHKGMNTGKQGLRFGGEKAAMQLHGKLDQHSGDNSAVKAAHQAE